MRFFLLAILVVLYCKLDAQTANTLMYQHGLRLKNIDIPGKPYKIRQACTNQFDSIISNGTVGFKHSKVGKITSCCYNYQISNDTLQNVIIYTYKGRNTKQAIAQLTMQFGQPQISQLNAGTSYQWPAVNSQINCRAVMITDSRKKTATITMGIL